MTTITTKQQQAIADILATMTLPRGLGTKENACSIAAINLALTGVLADTIPECMSEVIGKWIIKVQDSMPAEMRNSAEWKRLLPLAAGTGRKREKERLEIILSWMWDTVLPTLQPIADAKGFKDEWRLMLQQRTADAATAAARAAEHYAAKAAADAVTYSNAAAADYAAITAANATAATVAYSNADAANNAANAATSAANAGYHAHYGAHYAAHYGAVWQQFDPCGLLQKLIEV